MCLVFPDVYVYEFNSKQIASEISLGITDDELGQFFSDYMKGSKEEFYLVAEYRDREQSVFGTEEQINMENARRLLDNTLYIFGGAAILMLASYSIFLARKRKLEIKNCVQRWNDRICSDAGAGICGILYG